MRNKNIFMLGIGYLAIAFVLILFRSLAAAGVFVFCAATAFTLVLWTQEDAKCYVARRSHANQWATTMCIWVTAFSVIFSNWRAPVLFAITAWAFTRSLRKPQQVSQHHTSQQP